MSAMSAKNSAVSPEIYQLKVALLGTRPPIWRRLVVPSELNLAQLHDVLQVAMGWQDGHLQEFSAGGRRFGPPDRKTSSWPTMSEMSAKIGRAHV